MVAACTIYRHFFGNTNKRNRILFIDGPDVFFRRVDILHFLIGGLHENLRSSYLEIFFLVNRVTKNSYFSLVFHGKMENF